MRNEDVIKFNKIVATEKFKKVVKSKVYTCLDRNNPLDQHTMRFSYEGHIFNLITGTKRYNKIYPIKLSLDMLNVVISPMITFNNDTLEKDEEWRTASDFRPFHDMLVCDDVYVDLEIVFKDVKVELLVTTKEVTTVYDTFRTVMAQDVFVEAYSSELFDKYNKVELVLVIDGKSYALYTVKDETKKVLQ